MTEVFEAGNANDAWIKAVKCFSNQDLITIEDSRLGKTREILHANFCIHDPRQRWVLSRLPAINPAFAIVETFWILNGQNDSKLINHWNPILPKFMGKGLTYPGAYGYRIMKQFGFDQLNRAYNILMNNPKSRQVILQIWDPRQDLPHSNGTPTSEDIPCNICAMPKIRSGRLEWLQVMRSNDLYRGTPYNIVQFTTLQEILAGWLGVELGSYHQISDCLHIYENDLTELDYDQSLQQPQNVDKISIEKPQFHVILKIIIDRLYKLASSNLNISDFYRILDDTPLPSPYKNLLTIASCDSARRRGWIDEQAYALGQCQNDLLSLAMTRWIARKG